MKQTPASDSVQNSSARLRSGVRSQAPIGRKQLCQAFLAFVATCGPWSVQAQDGNSTARFAPLTPSVFRTSADSLSTNSQQQTSAHRLSRVSAAELTQHFIQGLGKHLQGQQNGHVATIQLPTTEAGACQLMIDHATHTVQLTGTAPVVSGWLNVVQALDAPQSTTSRRQFAYVPSGQQRTILQQLQQSTGLRATAQPNVYQVLQASDNGSRPLRARTAGFQDEAPPTEAPPETLPQDEGSGQGQQLPGSSLQVSVDPTTNALIVTGTDEDIKNFQRLISQLGEQAMQTRPNADVVSLTNSNSQALAAVIQQLYNDVFASRFGAATVTAIAEPNALVVSGSPQAIEELKSIIAKLDVESDDVRGTFQVFRLQHIAATNAANRLSAFFRTTATLPGTAQGGGFQGAGQAQPVLIIPDPRSNLIIMKGGSTELRQAKELLAEIDVVDGEYIKTQEVRVVQLRNSVATDMAQVIFAAINGGVSGVTPVLGSQGQFGGFGQQQQNQAQPNQDPSVANTALRLKLMSLDQNTGVISSGILFDVKVVADASSNSLVITGPAESLPLVEALIRELDRLPDAETQLKVFTIVNGDAQQLFDMLNQLFTQQQQQGGFGGIGAQNDGLTRLPLRSGSSDQTLVNLRFALELRTNTIIAAGSAGDLQVVEDLLTTLDRTNGDRFIKKVFRLSNAPAADTATTLTNTYNAEQQTLQQDPTTQAAIVNVRRRVVVQADEIQNHLIVIATPETMAEIEGLITALDRRPNMVAIQVMIAEVSLNSTEEFGVEFGVQDSIVFDRGLTGGAGAIGFPFNQNGIGNALNATGLATRENLAGQGLINLGVGRSNAALGYGGLVLSAGNESINILLRALKDQGRLQVLSRPHLMTIDNLNARVQVGQRVPYFSGSFINQLGGIQNQVTLEDVGIILEVVPRVGPDGLITMLVNVTNSSIGSEAEGTVVATDPQGQPIRQAPINITESITTAIARSEQTVVLSGLLRTQKQFNKRGVPILSDLPRLGPLFSFQSEREVRSELLIFLTPTVIHSHEDMAMYNQVEMDRMNWCFQDVMDLHGPIGNIFQGTFADGSGPEEVYPELRSPGVPPYLQDGHGSGVDCDPYEMQIPPMIEVAPSIAPAPLGSNGAPAGLPIGSSAAKSTDAAPPAPKEKSASGLQPFWRKN